MIFVNYAEKDGNYQNFQMVETLNRMPCEFKGAVFQKLASIADFSALNQHEQELYDDSLRKFRDTIAVMNYQRAEGRADASREMALRMKEKGIDIKSIAEITQLPETEVAAL